MSVGMCGMGVRKGLRVVCECEDMTVWAVCVRGQSVGVSLWECELV
jgi:hypothetical protein